MKDNLTIRYAKEDTDKEFFRTNFLHNTEDRIHLMAVGVADERLVKNGYWDVTFIAEYHGESVGYIQASMHNANSCCRIEELFVVKPYRKIGIGEELLLFTEKFAKDNWDFRIFDCLTIENEPMEKLLKKHGYVYAGSYDHFWYKADRWWTQSRWIK